MGWRAVPALLVVPVLVLGGCGGDGKESEPVVVCPSKEPAEAAADVSGLTLEQVYERMAEAMTCPGYALRVLHTGEGEMVPEEQAEEVSGFLNFTFHNSISIDPSADRARQDVQENLTTRGEKGEVLAERETERVEIVLGDVAYIVRKGEEPGYGRQAFRCHGSESPLTSLLLGCRGPTERSDTRLERDAEYQGQPTPALLTEGSTSGSDETTVFTDILYLDSKTLLPVVSMTEETLNNYVDASITVNAYYEYEFVPLASLAESFFDPAAIGYVEPDPEENLRGADVGITIYWLGVEFSGGDGLPPLTLDSAFPSSPPPEFVPGPHSRADIDYALAAERFGPPVLGLQEYPRTEWDEFLAQSTGGNWWDDRCLERIDMALGDRRALVFGGYKGRSPGCPEPTRTDWGAQVYIGDTVVLVSAPWRAEPGVEPARSLYNSREGMEAIARALVPYE